MKSIPEIAYLILNRRNTNSPFIMQGDMVNVLGAEGLREALSNRWLVADTFSGNLMVTQDASTLLEMRKRSSEYDASAPSAPVAENKWSRPWAAPVASRDSVLNHATRPINELLSPATGHDTSGPSRFESPTPTTPIKPSAPPASANTAISGNKPAIGDQVTVNAKSAGAQESQTYTGKVLAIDNGKVKVAFGDQTREFPETDVQILTPAKQA